MRTSRVFAISILTAGLAIAPAYGGSAGTGTNTGAGTEDRPLSERLDEVFRDLMEQMKPALDELLETLEVLAKTETDFIVLRNMKLLLDKLIINERLIVRNS